MKVWRLGLWPTSPSTPLPRLGHDVPVVSTRGQCGPNMAASWWDNEWCPSWLLSASSSFHSSVSTFFWLCSNKIPSNYISNVCFSLFQLRLARYAVPLVMISCLYFKVNHYLFIYFLVHFMCCTLSFAIVELSQFVQMCIDGREANEPQSLNMDVEIRSEKQVKYHEICLSHSLALMFSVTV